MTIDFSQSIHYFVHKSAMQSNKQILSNLYFAALYIIQSNCTFIKW